MKFCLSGFGLLTMEHLQTLWICRVEYHWMVDSEPWILDQGLLVTSNDVVMAVVKSEILAIVQSLTSNEVIWAFM